MKKAKTAKYAVSELRKDSWDVVVDHAIPGWRFTGLHVCYGPAADVRLEASHTERMIIPLQGSITATWDGRESGSAELTRSQGFPCPPDVLYLGNDIEVSLSSTGSFAVASAFSDASIATQLMRGGDIPVEIRGTGKASRQVHNFGTPGSISAQNLIICEVITPSGNWSSYPAHKHDTALPGKESRLEEIYYFETIAVSPHTPNEAVGHGYFHCGNNADPDHIFHGKVSSGEVVLVPEGFHGPAIASPEHDLYYLNVMAGPDPSRSWLITDDPEESWVRESWLTTPPDSRLPMKGRHK